MRCKLAYIGFYLVLGLLAHLAVVAVCSFVITVPQDNIVHGTRSGRESMWLVSMVRTPGAVRVRTLVMNDGRRWGEFPMKSVPHWSRAHRDPAHFSDLDRMYENEDARGWPLISIRCSVARRYVDLLRDNDPALKVIEVRDDSVLVEAREGYQNIDRNLDSDGRREMPLPRDGLVRGGILLPITGIDPPGVPRYFVLPLIPIWPEFIANTIFYTVIVWLLIGLPRAIRRRRRIKRSQCPACGYPIGTSTVCTECGADLTPKERRVVATAGAARSAKPTAAQPVDESAD